MRNIITVGKKKDIVGRIVEQVSNLPDIRLLLMRKSEPGNELRGRIESALNAYVDEEGRPIVGERGRQLAEDIIRGREYEAFGAKVPVEKGYRGPRVKAEVRAVTKEDRIADLKPVFNTPAEDETVDLKSFEKE